jgi:hypothetical protein
MWIPALDAIAKSDHWRLVVLSKPSCPAELVTVSNLPYYRQVGYPFVACDAWHQWAVAWINEHKPNVLVVTQEGPALSGKPIFGLYDAPGPNGLPPVSFFSPEQWARGLTSLFHSFTDPEMKTVLLGNIPRLPQTGPTCLSVHSNDVQACSAPTRSSISIFNKVEEDTALADAVDYIDPTPWFCSTTCTAVIGNYNVYLDDLHITSTWARYLEIVMAKALTPDLLPRR